MKEAVQVLIFIAAIMFLGLSFILGLILLSKMT